MPAKAFSRIALLLFVLIAANPSSLFGQVTRAIPLRAMSRAVPANGIEAAEPPQASTSSDDDSSAGEADEPANPNAKLVELLTSASFDRTPQAILEAWSYQPEPEGSAEEKAKIVSIDATAINSFEGIVVFKLESDSALQPNQRLTFSHDDMNVGKGTVLSATNKKLVVQLLPVTNEAEVSENLNSEKTSDVKQTEDDVSTEQPQESSDASEGLEDAADLGSSTESDSAVQETITLDAEDDNKGAAEVDIEPESAAIESVTEEAEEAEPTYPAINTGDLITLTLLPSEADIAKAQEASKVESAKEQADAFTRAVTLGHWDQVKATLGDLKPDDADKIYGHLLTSLAASETKVPDDVPEEMAQQILMQMQQSGQIPPTSYLSPDDILQLVEASPKPIRIRLHASKNESAEDVATDAMETAEAASDAVEESTDGQAKQEADDDEDFSKHIASLSTVMQISRNEGHDFNEFIELLDKGTTYFGGEDQIKRLTAARLLMDSALTEDVERFLPSLDDEETQADLNALPIWSELAIEKHASTRVAEWLEKAWRINQWIVSNSDVEKEAKDLALNNLIELSPKVDKELGQKWLEASFTQEPTRGMKILANLGSQSATMAEQAAMTSESRRLKLLRLQNNAAENLIKLQTDDSTEWSQALTLLAQNWLAEAETSLQYSKQNSRQSFMQIDMYGNYYWVDENQRAQMYGGMQQPRPIKLGDVLEISPSEEWRAAVSPSLFTQMRTVTANLHLRLNEEDKAFPYIEALATTHPKVARELVHEFLKIWTRNHDPNTDRRQRNPYIYFYGFDQKAEAIPLTRSKQERNLIELSGWVDRIREMPIEDVDENLLANAFTTCHSSAEVFRIEAVKSVFGELENLKPETVAAICEKMRSNLASNWREVRTQEQKQTNRREPEVKQEVLRGYEVATTLAKEAMGTAPDNWQLHLVLACLMFDENAYSQSVQKSSEFSDRRDLAFAQFEVATKKYQEVAMTLEEKDQSTEVFDKWFYAALGAVDLGKITDKTLPDLKQYPKIRTAIESLPGNLAEDHMAKVANNMFTRMSPIKPEIKFRYLRGGFEIVGDHPRAWEARNLYDYYRDLVSEIKLQVEVDGDADVGHSQPFGVFVSILHTVEIERESGGFGKYVQNQNNMMYAFNYGRPTENYRDKFNDSIDQALGEHYEVLSVTFQSAEEMESRPADQEGWRLTPYAYVLLQPKGSEVDRIASLKLDLDFLDTSGYVVIPIESPALVVNCLEEDGSPRPVTDLEITQTLDERQAEEGKLIVEISAKGKGLVPDLEALIETEADNFEVVSIDDQGVLPTAFDTEGDELKVLSDRSWTVEYKARDDQNEKAREFKFSDVKMAEAKSKFQRYNDADLVAAEQTVRLERSYGKFSWAFLYWLVPLVLIGLLGLGGLVYTLSRPALPQAERFVVPEDVNPFTVLTLLKDIKARNGISTKQAQELETSINRIEEFYFGGAKEEQPGDLVQLAQTWVSKAR